MAPVLGVPVLCGLLSGPHPTPDVHVPVPTMAAPGPLVDRDPFGTTDVRHSEHFALRFDHHLAPTEAEADQLLTILEDAWDAGVEDLGMPPPRASSVAYVNAYLGNSGPNAPPIAFTGGYVSIDLDAVPFLVISVDMLPYMAADPSSTESITSHEFFHVLQHSGDAFKGYLDLFATADQAWFWESTASWFAHEILPGNQAAATAPGAYLLRPQLAVDHVESPPSGDLEDYRLYHSALFHRYLTEHVASPQLVVDAWTTGSATADPLDVIDALLLDEGTSLLDTLPGFATHNAAVDYDDEAMYDLAVEETLQLGYDDERLVGELDGTQLPTTVEPDADVAPRALGYNVVRIEAPPVEGLSVMLAGEPEGSLGTETRLQVAWVADEAGGFTHGLAGAPTATGSWELRDPAVIAADTVWLAVVAVPDETTPLEWFGYTLDVDAATPLPTDTTDTTDTAEPYSGTTSTDAPVDSGAPEEEPTPDDDRAGGGCGCAATTPTPIGVGVWLLGRRRRAPPSSVSR